MVVCVEKRGERREERGERGKEGKRRGEERRGEESFARALEG